MTITEREALAGLLHHIGAMQERMRAYLKPDSGVSAEAFAAEIIELLDGPQERLHVGAARAVLGPDLGHSISTGTKR